jgi:hypothetical protein
MKFYPYAKVKTENFGLLLFAARATTILGFLSLLVSAFMIIAALTMGGSHTIGNGISIETPAFGFATLFVGLWASFACIGLFLVGGIAAAIVAIESHLSAVAVQKTPTGDL